MREQMLAMLIEVAFLAWRGYVRPTESIIVRVMQCRVLKRARSTATANRHGICDSNVQRVQGKTDLYVVGKVSESQGPCVLFLRECVCCTSSSSSLLSPPLQYRQQKITSIILPVRTVLSSGPRSSSVRSGGKGRTRCYDSAARQSTAS